MTAPRTKQSLEAMFDAAAKAPALGARGLIQVYRYSLSSLIGRQCRHLPTCSEYTDEAIRRHGLWAGGWIGLARICRCGPGGTSGIDNVDEALPASAAWYKPWNYGRWRSVNAPPAEVEPSDGASA